MLEFAGQIAIYKGGPCFNQYLSEYSILEVETFWMYSYMIELSAHVRRRYGHMRVSLDGTSKLIFIFKFSFFFTCMGDPPRGDRQC